MLPRVRWNNSTLKGVKVSKHFPCIASFHQRSVLHILYTMAIFSIVPVLIFNINMAPLSATSRRRCLVEIIEVQERYLPPDYKIPNSEIRHRDLFLVFSQNSNFLNFFQGLLLNTKVIILKISISCQKIEFLNLILDHCRVSRLNNIIL